MSAKSISSPASESQAGFTIIESLVAIVVVAILLSAIAPVIVFSVATRLQARRTEVATQAARAYVDSLRSGSLVAPRSIVATTAAASFPLTTPAHLKDANYAAPTATGTLTCTANSYCTAPAPASGDKELFCFDADGDNACTTASLMDMVVQGFRYNRITNDPDKGYQLGVRVYRASAFKDSVTLKKTDTQATFTAGVGRRDLPLLEMTTEIATRDTSYNDIFRRTAQP